MTCIYKFLLHIWLLQGNVTKCWLLLECLIVKHYVNKKVTEQVRVIYEACDYAELSSGEQSSHGPVYDQNQPMD